ncbi:MAG: hypothetical protein AAFR53_12060 [Pseudomonadota bacterium]
MARFDAALPACLHEAQGIAPQDLTFMAIEDLSADERRGFLFACATMRAWASDIEAKTSTMAGADMMIPLSLQMRNSVNFAAGLAQTMAQRARR